MNRASTPIGVLQVRGGTSRGEVLTGGRPLRQLRPPSIWRQRSSVTRPGSRGRLWCGDTNNTSPHMGKGGRMKRITRFKKRTWVLLGVVAVIAAMASVGAYAYWTTSGSATGTATVGTRRTTWTVTSDHASGDHAVSRAARRRSRTRSRTSDSTVNSKHLESASRIASIEPATPVPLRRRSWRDARLAGTSQSADDVSFNVRWRTSVRPRATSTTRLAPNDGSSSTRTITLTMIDDRRRTRTTARAYRRCSTFTTS